MADMNIAEAREKIGTRGFLDVEVEAPIRDPVRGDRIVEKGEKRDRAGALLPGTGYPGCGRLYR